MNKFQAVNVPFDERHKCWFCGEPYFEYLDFPSDQRSIHLLSHAPCALPVCSECKSFIIKQKRHSIYSYQSLVKQALAKKYQKALQIGLLWTEQELADAELEGAAFLGFKESAWLMYEIAASRINYMGWPIEIEGKELFPELDTARFTFDGLQFENLNSAVKHYASAYQLNEKLLTDVVERLGQTQFSFAIRLCRLYPNIKIADCELALREIESRINQQIL